MFLTRKQRLTATWLRLHAALLCGILLGLAGCGKPAVVPSGSKSKPASPHVSNAKKQKGLETAPVSEVKADAPDESAEKSAAAAAAKPVPVAPQRVYRPSDTRPRHDEQRLRKAGIIPYSSKRLLLYTDLDPKLAETLPGLTDQAYAAWEEYFGMLPPDREGADFQITGYLMVDRQRFVDSGLVPQDLAPFRSGRHRGSEFWMNDQKADYYRRHLLIHEGTHCFMVHIPSVMGPEAWYMEGMAELFGTHTIDEGGRVQFRVMPRDPDQFQGFGRIRMVDEDVRDGRLHDLEDVFKFDAIDGQDTVPYAWSWALCKFLDTHPRYRERFRHVQEHVSPRDPNGDFRKLFAPDWADLRDEWLLFASNLCFGYDIPRASIEFKPGRPLPGRTDSAMVQVAADRGWQSSEVRVEKGRTYRIAAEGRFSVAQEPEPWECEPQGVSIRYVQGRPLGMLVATIRAAAPPEPLAEPKATLMLTVIPVGRGRELTPEITGTVYFRINDFWNELGDNKGSVQVTVEEVGKQ